LAQVRTKTVCSGEIKNMRFFVFASLPTLAQAVAKCGAAMSPDSTAGAIGWRNGDTAAVGTVNAGCGIGKTYDSSKSNTDCAANACLGSTTADVTACCKAQQFCLELTDSSVPTQNTVCPPTSFKKLMTGTRGATGIDVMCSAATCSAADTLACCFSTCGSIKSTVDFCGANKRYQVKATPALQTTFDQTTSCAAATCLTATAADVTACCQDTDGQKCGATTGGATEDGWCGVGKTYDITKKDNKCLGNGAVFGGLADGACAAGHLGDIVTCCKATAGEKCGLAGGKGSDPGFCPAGTSYAIANKDSMCKSTTVEGGCSSTVKDDTNACCVASTGVACTAATGGATADGWCTTAGQTLAVGTTRKCTKNTIAPIKTDCDKTNADDQKSCCVVAAGQKCSEGFIAKGLCPAGRSYLAAVNSKNFCVATGANGGCDKTKLDDSNSCCSLNTGMTCSEIANKVGWCPAGQSYDKTKASNKCVKKTADGGCSSSDADDVMACCSVSTGQMCKDGAAGKGWCSSASGANVYSTALGTNRCVGTTCDNTVKDDVTACCVATSGAKCDTIAKKDGFCGIGASYGLEVKDLLCFNKICSSSDPDDVNVCCEFNVGEGTCGKGAAAEGFCGVGKMYNKDMAAKQCVGKVCDASRADDVNACCKLLSGASCSTVAKIDGFCGADKTYDIDKAGNNCVGPTCSSVDAADILSCCKMNDGALCSTIATSSNYCGADMEYSIAKATKKCSVSPCSGTAADVAQCCQKTTTKLTTTGTAKSPTIGQTDGAWRQQVLPFFVVLSLVFSI